MSPTLTASENRKQDTLSKTGFPFIVQKPVSSAVGSDGLFLFAEYTRKNVFFRT